MKPIILEKLKHDKVLTKANFPKFVETFNYMVDFIDNLRGDADSDPQHGHIKVVDKDFGHPIIKLTDPDGSLSGADEAQPDNIEPWTVFWRENRFYNPTFQIGTFRGEADCSGVDISALVNTTQNHSIYCCMDLAKLSACVQTYPTDDITHQSVKVMNLSCISADSGLKDDDDNPIIQWRQFYEYTCRYPIAPVWESFTF